MERVSRGDCAMNKRRAAEIAKLGSIYNPNWSQHTQDEDGQERVIREECWGRPQESRRGLLKLIHLPRICLGIFYVTLNLCVYEAGV